MPVKKYTVKLEGKSQLHSPTVKLEGIKLNLSSDDKGVTWQNKDAIVSVVEKLDIFMSCEAMTGTGWSFEIKNNESSKKVYEEEGETGDGGQDNYSERSDSVEP